MAARNVTITCTQEAGPSDPAVVKIDYSFSGGVDEPNRVRAFALDVSVDSGATIDAISDYVTGESSQHSGRGYGIFPGSIDLTDPENPGWGDPVAPASDRGASGTGLGTDRVILEMGSLYAGGDPNAPASSGTLCRLSVGGNGAETATMTINGESIRGGEKGVVLEEPPGDAPDSINLPTNCPLDFGGVQECMMEDHPDYGAWETAGKPDCWCYLRQCRGDGNGVWEGPLPVASQDLDAFRLAFNNHFSLFAANPVWWCSDYDHVWEGPLPVASGDLGILRTYLNEHFSLVPECDGTYINFWITP
jgi:hypothetical protein